MFFPILSLESRRKTLESQNMKNQLSLVFVVLFLCCLAPGNTEAQSLLNKIGIDQCNPHDPKEAKAFDSGQLDELIKGERRRGLVLDVRRFAINQATGKLNFNGETGRVSVVHTNPFLYEYTISVEQEELVSSALSDFIGILLPPGLRGIGTGAAAAAAAEARSATTVRGNLMAIARRLGQVDCPNSGDPECKAVAAMQNDVAEIQKRLEPKEFAVIMIPPPAEVLNLTNRVSEIRDEQADAYTTCTRAHVMNEKLREFQPTAYANTLKAVQVKIDDLKTLVDDLLSLANEFSADEFLKGKHVRCNGFECVGQFKAYAETVEVIVNGYQETVNERLQTAQALEALLDMTDKMKGKEGVFARTFEIIKKFELSEATVSITRKRIEPKKEPEAPDTAESFRANPSRRRAEPTRRGNPFDSPPAGNGNHDEEAEKKDEKAKDEDEPAPPKPPTPDINESVQIGRSRFLVSGGLVYSPLPRQTFTTTTGFSHDAQGIPTGDGNKSIVGFEENSPRRLLPMVFLNSRLASFKPASIYFTLGVTAKHDRDIDVEYLLGPSVSMLNERAMFTFGAYAGKTSALVPDVRVGDEIPDSAGNASLFTKHYTWKPGFSFSYVFSNLTKRSEHGGTTGTRSASASAEAADEFKDEIRIGGIPFNLAMGLAYTSLEDRTFDEVLGFARDRQGNLTNGQALTRIVGLGTSSNYRLVPLAMLHSRLLNFGRHSFYFTSGVSGKKDDDNVQIEYLLGGSVNLYQRKLFFTFGAFAGKQQVLNGDLFPGGKLDPNQNVAPGTRYVWKPAFAFSYDISRIMPKGTKK
jgi:hypothetical protein